MLFGNTDRFAIEIHVCEWAGMTGHERFMVYANIRLWLGGFVCNDASHVESANLFRVGLNHILECAGHRRCVDGEKNMSAAELYEFLDSHLYGEATTTTEEAHEVAVKYSPTIVHSSLTPIYDWKIFAVDRGVERRVVFSDRDGKAVHELRLAAGELEGVIMKFCRWYDARFAHLRPDDPPHEDA